MNLMDISRIKYVSLGDLVPDPANARRHNDRFGKRQRTK